MYENIQRKNYKIMQGGNEHYRKNIYKKEKTYWKE